MKNINWKARIKNKLFWFALIPALMVLVQSVASLFGFTLDLADVVDKLINVVEAVFVLLAIIGIVVDPTTEGLSDSTQALSYEKPKAKEE